MEIPGPAPRRGGQRLACVPLMLARGDSYALMPADEDALAFGDHLLFCGRAAAASAMAWTLQNTKALTYVLTGREVPETTAWRWVDAMLKRARLQAR